MCRSNLYNTEASDETDLSPYPKICNFRPNIFVILGHKMVNTAAVMLIFLHLMLWGTEKYALWSTEDTL